MIVRVKRQASADAESYWQSFDVDAQNAQDALTAAAILDELGQRKVLLDVDGRPAEPVSWECSCLQGVCGACAMVIDGTPGLACQAFVDANAGTTVTLEPLTRFPVVKDLIVDRSCILEHQRQAKMFLGERRASDPREFEQQYCVAKCLKCGLCLEVCPNYAGPNGSFYGAVLANEAYLLTSMTASRVRELRREHRRHFERGCSKSLACRDICPAKIATLSSIGYMNRPR